MGRQKALYGLQDARSMRGILARGPARYGPGGAPKTGNLFDVQKAAKARLKKMRNRKVIK